MLDYGPSILFLFFLRTWRVTQNVRGGLRVIALLGDKNGLVDKKNLRAAYQID